MTDEAWPRRYAAALDGQALPSAEVDAVLELARLVAHGTERRFAPLSTFLAGRYVAARVAAGVPAGQALGEALDVARGLLDDGNPGTISS
jgi:hypothetical protein